MEEGSGRRIGQKSIMMEGEEEAEGDYDGRRARPDEGRRKKEETGDESSIGTMIVGKETWAKTGGTAKCD